MNFTLHSGILVDYLTRFGAVIFVSCLFISVSIQLNSESIVDH